jgi:hypothetical protein
MTILEDPVRPFDLSSHLELVEIEQEADARGKRPEPLVDPDGRSLPSSSRLDAPPRPGDEVRAGLRARGPRGKTTFELASRGGYVRTVTGTN